MRRILGMLLLSMVLAATSFHTLACVDEVEWNNDLEYADYIGSVPGNVCGVGTIGEPGDIDVWAFEITQPALVRIETSSGGGVYTGDTTIVLVDEDSVSIAGDDDSGDGYFSLIDFMTGERVLAPGYYFVAVADVNADFSSAEPYKVTVEGIPPTDEPDEPEDTSTAQGDCDMSWAVGVNIDWHMYVRYSTGSVHEDRGAIFTDRDREELLVWSGTSFSLTYTQKLTHAYDGYVDDTITIVSVSGRLSEDCGTLLTCTAREEETYRSNGVVESISTVEITLANLPLNSHMARPEGQGIADFVTHFEDRFESKISPEDSFWVESLEPRSDDRLEFGFGRMPDGP